MFEEIKGVVEITGDLYVKNPEALEILFGRLREIGYQIKNLREADYRKEDGVSIETMEKNGWFLWFAQINLGRGKCHSCQGLIDRNAIHTYKHRCELCGAYTYLEFVDGTIVYFVFLDDWERKPLSKEICMKVYDYEVDTKTLLLYPEPLEGSRFGSCRIDEAKKVLSRNMHSIRKIPAKPSKGIRKYLRRLKAKKDYETLQQVKSGLPGQYGKPLLAIYYDTYTFSKPRSETIINMFDVEGSKKNYHDVRVWEGKEYGEYDRNFPIRETISIHETWHWAPLKPSPSLHEKIIHAARMVSDCGYYYQDGRREFEDVHLARMRKFVEHFTQLNLEEWDEMIKHADKSGPGMIRAIARFCHQKPRVENRPNFGNVLVGLGKITDRQPLTADEVSAMQDAISDSKEVEKLAQILRS